MVRWTRNQKILVATFIVLLGGNISFISLGYLNYKEIQENQIIIVQQVDEIKGKVGNFEKLITEGIYLSNSSNPDIHFNGSGICIGGC